MEDFLGTAKAWLSHSTPPFRGRSTNFFSIHCSVIFFIASLRSPYIWNVFWRYGTAFSLRGMVAYPYRPLTGGSGTTSSLRAVPSKSSCIFFLNSSNLPRLHPSGKFSFPSKAVKACIPHESSSLDNWFSITFNSGSPRKSRNKVSTSVSKYNLIFFTANCFSSSSAMVCMSSRSFRTQRLRRSLPSLS